MACRLSRRPTLLRRGLEVAVGTPGRIIDLYKQGFLNLKQVKIVVLDEADEMLDLGFQPSVEKILSYLPEKRQSMLFSATMPGPVIAMARQYMTKPMRISAADPEDASKTKRRRFARSSTAPTTSTRTR